MRRNTRGAQLGGGDHKLVGLPQRVCAKALTLGAAAATGHLAPILRPCATHGGRKLGAGTASSKVCHKGSVHKHLHSGQPPRPAVWRPSCAPAQHTGGASWRRGPQAPRSATKGLSTSTYTRASRCDRPTCAHLAPLRNTRGAQVGGGDHRLRGLPQRVCPQSLTLRPAAATGRLAPILRPCATHGGRKLG